MGIILFVPSVILRIVQQITRGSYVLFNNIYLCYFAILVVLLNGFFQYHGYNLIKTVRQVAVHQKIPITKQEYDQLQGNVLLSFYQ